MKSVKSLRKTRKTSRVSVVDEQPNYGPMVDGNASPDYIAVLNDLAQSVKARLSGLGEPPQLGNRVTLADIQKAIRHSELGEPYYMFALNRDMIENDSHLQAEIGKRVMSFMGPEEIIEPFDKTNKDDVVASEVIQDMISACENWPKGSVHLAMGHIWPISSAEKIFEKIAINDPRFRHPCKWRLKKLHPVPWPLYTYKVAYWNVNMVGGAPGEGMVPNGVLVNSGALPVMASMNHTALELTNLNPNFNQALIWNPDDWHPDLRFYNTFANGLIDWTMNTCYKPNPVRHVIHQANVATGSLRDNFGGVLRSLIPLWFYKKNLLDWFVQKMERYGGPFAVAKAATQNKNVTDMLTKAFNEAMKINALLVPAGTEIELKEINVTAMADGFVKGIQTCNEEMTKAILGQTLSTTSKGSGMMGGSGVADLHGEVRAEWGQFDKNSYARMQQEQIFSQFLNVNGYRGRCKSVRGGMTPANLAVFTTSLKNAAGAGVFPAPEAEADISKFFGMRMVVKDVTQMNKPDDKKSKKSDKD